MKFSLLLLAILGTALSLQAVEADHNPFRQNGDEWLREGQLVTVKIRKGSPVQIFVTGREAVKLDLNQIKFTARRTQPSPMADLKLEREGDHYILRETQVLNSATELQFHADVKGQKEDLTFQIRGTKP